MGFALSGAAGAASATLEDILKQKYLEQMQMAELAERQRQNDMQHNVSMGQLNLGNRRLEQDASQFDVTSGQAKQRLDMDREVQPVRIKQMQAQTADIERQPKDAEDAFARQMQLQGLRGGQELQQIQASGDQSARVARIRRPGEEAGPQQTPAQKNEVDDAITLIDQILADPSLPNAIGPIDQYAGGIINADPAGVTRFKGLSEQLVGKLSLAQAGKLRGQGQISDKERALLAAAASALRRGMSEGDYKAELGKIRQQFERMKTGSAAGAVGVQEYDYVPGKGLVPRQR